MDTNKLRDEVVKILNEHPIDEVTYSKPNSTSIQIKSEYIPKSMRKEFDLYEYAPHDRNNYLELEFYHSFDEDFDEGPQGPVVGVWYDSYYDGKFDQDLSKLIVNMPAEYVRGVALSLKKQDGSKTMLCNDFDKEPNVKIYLAPTYETAKEFAENNTIDATVEAEYGDEFVEGKYYTLAHHGNRSDHCAPCVGDKGVSRFGALEDGDIVLISHIDLDTIGGIMQLKGQKPQQGTYVGIGGQQLDPFWYSAAYVDVNGPHRECDLPKTAVEDIHAYHAWAQAQPRVRYTEVTDVTDIIKAHEERIKTILSREVEVEISPVDGMPIKTILSRTAESEKAVEEGKEWNNRVTSEIERQRSQEDTISETQEAAAPKSHRRR